MAPEYGNPIHHLPLIPAGVLNKHHCHQPVDTRFRSATRKDRKLPIGSYVDRVPHAFVAAISIEVVASRNGLGHLVKTSSTVLDATGTVAAVVAEQAVTSAGHRSQQGSIESKRLTDSRDIKLHRILFDDIHRTLIERHSHASCEAGSSTLGRAAEPVKRLCFGRASRSNPKAGG